MGLALFLWDGMGSFVGLRSGPQIHHYVRIALPSINGTSFHGTKICGDGAAFTGGSTLLQSRAGGAGASSRGFFP